MPSEKGKLSKLIYSFRLLSLLAIIVVFGLFISDTGEEWLFKSTHASVESIPASIHLPCTKNTGRKEKLHFTCRYSFIYLGHTYQGSVKKTLNSPLFLNDFKSELLEAGIKQTPQVVWITPNAPQVQHIWIRLGLKNSLISIASSLCIYGFLPLLGFCFYWLIRWKNKP